MHRSSGVLLHISSLPGGRLGREAYRFVDWLVEAGQSWWALLPLAPPDSTGSPYASPSAFAAHAGFLERPHARVTPDELEAFVARERYWIADWAAFAGTGAIAGQVRFEGMRPAAASGSSVTSRSTSRRAPPTSRRTRTSSRRASSPERRRTG